MRIAGPSALVLKPRALARLGARYGVLVTHPELIIDGGLDDPNAWSHTNITIAGSKATWSGTSANLQQEPITFVGGATYRFIYTVGDYTAGTTRAILIGGVGVFGTTRSGAGVYSEDLVAIAGSNGIRIAGASTPSLSVDNVSCKRIS